MNSFVEFEKVSILLMLVLLLVYPSKTHLLDFVVQ